MFSISSLAASRHRSFRSFMVTALAAALLTQLGGCGGGSSSTATPTPTPTPTGNDGGGASTPPARSLQAHLSVCPTTLTINESVACMGGLYESTTADTGAYCAFNYNSDSGVANYIVGTQAVRVELNVLSSGAVFEKKAASTAAGFAISWSIGIASGKEVNLYYQSSGEPASANGLLIKPKAGSLSACLVTAGPAAAATGSASTANLLGRSWQSPQALNGSTGAVGYFSDQPAFDAGLADDGRAVITWRQPDASGRMAVYVVQGESGAADRTPTWTEPEVLDADAPLLTGNFRPRIAVSGTGHAVVSWMTEQPCGADAPFEAQPAGKNCRYLYASRRLASDARWEPAVRVRSAPVLAAQDHFARINARGDVVLALPSYYPLSPDPYLASTTLAIRNVDEAAYRAVWLRGFYSNAQSTDPFADYLSAELDDAGTVFAAGTSTGFPSYATHIRSSTSVTSATLSGESSVDAGPRVYELRTSGNGFAAYTWNNGSNNRDNPGRLTVYSPASRQWLTYDTTAYTLWGDTGLVSTDHPDGEFLLISGCKITVWRAGTWSATRNLPAYCGGDQAGGTYAFNRKGDYIGIDWGGQPGQWGYYSYAQDKVLKGAPGTGTAVSGDYVLGIPSNLFETPATQLLLAPSGLALAVTTNNFTTLPSATNPAGVPGGAAHKLWAVYLK